MSTPRQFLLTVLADWGRKSHDAYSISPRTWRGLALPLSIGVLLAWGEGCTFFRVCPNGHHRISKGSRELREPVGCVVDDCADSDAGFYTCEVCGFEYDPDLEAWIRSSTSKDSFRRPFSPAITSFDGAIKSFSAGAASYTQYVRRDRVYEECYYINSEASEYQIRAVIGRWFASMHLTPTTTAEVASGLPEELVTETESTWTCPPYEVQLSRFIMGGSPTPRSGTTTASCVVGFWVDRDNQ